jgi:2,3-bisphosphoglycerate-dependent phosphoglycerate mutase
MKRYIAFFVFSLFFQHIYAQTSSITTFILVRHAEKGNDGTDDPDLTPEGIQRAKKLAGIFKNTAVDAVYSTRYKRTKNTVEPLAQQKGKEVMLYENVKPATLDDILTKYPGGTILIGGHSNTIPQLANQLVGREEFKTFDDSDYGNILIISVVEKGKVAKATLLNY